MNKDKRIPPVPMEHAISGFRTHFPLLEQKVYLDTAAWGLLHDGLFQWRREHDRDFLEGGSRFKIRSLQLLDQTRQRIAECFGGKEERIALVPNFSLGMNLLLEGLPEPCTVALFEGEYPSVAWPFEQRRFQIHPIPRESQPEEAMLRVLEREKPDILALSLVQWIDGLLIHPDFLKDVKEAFPDLLILADGTQFLGAFTADFDKSGIDVLGASGYKWMLGGNGNGFMMLSESAEERVKAHSSGFNSTGGDLSFTGNLSLARSLEPGHLDTLNFGSLHYSLGLLQEIGFSNIEAFSRDMSRQVHEALAAEGLLEQSIASREQHSTIFNIPYNENRFAALKENGIVCSRRGGGIRLSFHCYNNSEDLEHLMAILRL